MFAPKLAAASLIEGCQELLLLPEEITSSSVLQAILLLLCSAWTSIYPLRAEPVPGLLRLELDWPELAFPDSERSESGLSPCRALADTLPGSPRVIARSPPHQASCSSPALAPASGQDRLSLPNSGEQLELILPLLGSQLSILLLSHNSRQA